MLNKASFILKRKKTTGVDWKTNNTSSCIWHYDLYFSNIVQVNF